MVITLINFLGSGRLFPWLWQPFYGNLIPLSKDHVSLTKFSKKLSQGMSKFVCLRIWRNICPWWGLKGLFDGLERPDKHNFLFLQCDITITIKFYLKIILYTWSSYPRYLGMAFLGLARGEGEGGWVA